MHFKQTEINLLSKLERGLLLFSLMVRQWIFLYLLPQTGRDGCCVLVSFVQTSHCACITDIKDVLGSFDHCPGLSRMSHANAALGFSLPKFPQEVQPFLCFW